MIMNYFYCGIHYGAIVFVDAAGEVDVFGVHKELWVEEAYVAQCVIAQKHEASGEVWYV